MSTIEQIAVDRDAGGFLTDPQQWNEEIAVELAHEAGINELTPRHWQVVHYMRDTYLATGNRLVIAAGDPQAVIKALQH